MGKGTIGIIGVGKLGITLAQLGLKAGYEVLIASSKPPEKIALTLEVLAPGAVALEAAQVMRQGTIILLALPLSKYSTLSKTDLKGKIVIDAMNYWWEVDGPRDPSVCYQTSSSEEVQQFFDQSLVVKAFNHMGYHDLADEAAFSNECKRKAIAYAGHDAEALEKTRQLIDDLGFAPYYLGELSKGIMLEPGSELFGANIPVSEMKEKIEKFPQSDFGQKIKQAREKKNTAASE